MREGKRKSAVASLSITAFQIWFRMTAPSVTSGNKIKVTRQGADLGEEDQLATEKQHFQKLNLPHA